MTIEEILVLVVMAAVLGVLSQRVLGTKLGGLIVSIVLGIIGAFVGRMIGHHIPMTIRFNLEIGDARFPVLWSLFGALVTTFLVGLVAKSASKREKKK